MEQGGSTRTAVSAAESPQRPAVSTVYVIVITLAVGLSTLL